MIKLIDLLQIPESEFKNYKIHLAVGAKNRLKPYKKFLIGEFKGWQEQQTQKNFSRKYILSLIHYDRHIWLFGGVYEVLPVKPVPIQNGAWTGWKYQTKLLDIQTDLIGRAYIYYEKYFRTAYPTLELMPSDGASMAPRDAYISSIIPTKASINEFVGFDKINIDYETLNTIITNSIPSWKSALSNVKGIYLISDKLTGKNYVGSAYGDDCIWQRWSEYAKNGHGNNVQLKKLLSTHGEKYKYNFKYAILEVCNMNLGNEYIISRETHWKEVLQTRTFGLNDN